MICNGLEILKAVKLSANNEGPTLCIQMGAPFHAYLRPVATLQGKISQEDIVNLTNWRNKHVNAFLSEFKATEARTTEWLVSTVGSNDNKVLFMVCDSQGNTLGYMGLAFIDWNAASGEADAIVRGEAAPKGLMRDCLLKLISWAKGSLGLKKISVRVRSDNAACEFYKQLGFVEIKRIGLKAGNTSSDFIQWNEDTSIQDASVSLVYMIFEN